MRYINIIAATFWGFLFIGFITGDYEPSRTTIGLSMFLATFHFTLLFIYDGIEDKRNKKEKSLRELARR